MGNKTSLSQDVKSGLFVLLTTILMIASIVLTGGERSFFTSQYELKAKFKQVQGLSIGSVVSLSGINAGNVTAIEFNPEDNMIELKLRIDEIHKNKITDSAQASVKTQGALGDKYIYIDPKGMEGVPLPDGSFIASESRGDLFDILSEEGPKIAQISTIVKELKTLLSNLNKDDNSAELMKNLASASKKLDKFLGESTNLVADMRNKNQWKDSATKLNSILNKIDKGQGTLGALINDPSLHEQVITLMGKRPRNSYLKPLIRATIKAKDEKESN